MRARLLLPRLLVVPLTLSPVASASAAAAVLHAATSPTLSASDAPGWARARLFFLSQEPSIVSVFERAWNWIDAYLCIVHGLGSELYRFLRQVMTTEGLD